MEGTNQNENRQVDAPITSGIDARLIFGDNKHFAFIYKKTEKLVTAVYMITNFIKDNEPLKWNIRENALSLMSLNISFNTVSLSERKNLLKEYRALSLEIVSLANIAHHSGLISEMNSHILAREFGNLVNILEHDENKRSNEETVVLDPGFFNTPSNDAPKREETIERSNSPRPAPARSNDVLYTPGELRMNKGHAQTEKAPAASVDLSAPARKAEYFPLKDIQEKAEKAHDSKDSRQSTIIKLLSKKSGLSIKDFEGSIKGVSSKTIQRELLAMVASGVLKKEGERRWSTYSLAK